MKPPITYVGMDGTRLDFPVPKTANRGLVARAIRKIHDGGNADLAIRGLTEPEHELVLLIIGTLEEHRIPVAV